MLVRKSKLYPLPGPLDRSKLYPDIGKLPLLERDSGGQLLEGLVAAWMMNEASGTRFDSHTNGLDCADNNTVTSEVWPDGPDNRAVFTKLNSEYLSIANASATLLEMDTDDWTVHIAFEHVGTDNCLIYTGGHTPTVAGWRVVARSTDMLIGLADGTTLIQMVAPAAIAATQYLSVTKWDRDGDVSTSLNLGADSTLDISALDGNIIGNGFDFNIGALINGAVFHLEGNIGSCLVWNRLTTAAEDTFLYNSGSFRTFAEISAF